MKVTAIRLDIIKQIFQIHSTGAKRRTILQRLLRRNRLADNFKNLPAKTHYRRALPLE